MWARIKIELPDARGQNLRQFLGYMAAKDLTLLEFLESHLHNLRSSFGPECTVSIESHGAGTAPDLNP